MTMAHGSCSGRRISGISSSIVVSRWSLVVVTRRWSTMMNRQIRLQSRPAGIPTVDNFETVDVALPAVNEGDVLRRTLYLSLDPYMRGRMSDAPSYAPPVNLHDVMCGHT